MTNYNDEDEEEEDSLLCCSPPPCCLFYEGKIMVLSCSENLLDPSSDRVIAGTISTFSTPSLCNFSCLETLIRHVHVHRHRKRSLTPLSVQLFALLYKILILHIPETVFLHLYTIAFFFFSAYTVHVHVHVPTHP